MIEPTVKNSESTDASALVAELSEKVPKLTTALRGDFLNPNLHNELCEVYLKAEMLSLAEDHARLALHLDSSNDQYAINLFNALALGNKAPLAIESIIQFVKHNPHSIEAAALLTDLETNSDISFIAETPELRSQIVDDPEKLLWNERRVKRLLGTLPAFYELDLSQIHEHRRRAQLSQARNSPRKVVSSISDELSSRLVRCGWASRQKRYQSFITKIETAISVTQPSISVVIISWRQVPALSETLKILELERGVNFELIFVDNGAAEGEFAEAKSYADTCITLKRNAGAYLPRNIGAAFASAPLLLFLEDDGIPAENFLRAHLDAHTNYEAYSIRGSVFPLELDLMHLRAKHQWEHYNMGRGTFPYCDNFEGNVSYQSEMFYAVGGWDNDIIFGHGGIELAARIIEKDPNLSKHLYCGEALLFHNYLKGESHAAKKRFVQEMSRRRLMQKHPGLAQLRQSWDPMFQDATSVIRRR